MLDENLITDLSKLPWNEFVDLLESAKDDEEAFKLLVIHRCATDLEFYTSFFFAHYKENDFNAFHLELFKSVKWRERAVRRARGAPRGSAKSSNETLVKPIHDVCYGLEKLIIIISSNELLSTAKLKDIRMEVLTNALLIEYYGLSFPVKTPGTTQFIVNSDNGSCMFVALGKGAQIRGIRFGPHRPSKIICDDVETAEEVDNESIRRKVEQWYFADVTKAGNPKTNICFVGTVLHRDSLLSNLLTNSAYDSKLYKSVVSWSEREDLWNEWRAYYNNLDDPDRKAHAQAFYEANEKEMLRGTEVLWPDREPYLYLMQELVEIGKLAFWKEKQNTPLGSEDTVFDTIHYFTEKPEGLFIESSQTLLPWAILKYEAYGVIDPSTGQAKSSKGKTSDFSVVLTGYRCPRGRLLVYKDVTKRLTPTKFIKLIFNEHEQFKYQKFGVETNLFRDLLMDNLREERKRLESQKGEVIKLAFYDIHQTENKQERIFKIEPKVSNGWIVFNRALSQEFIGQLQDFPKAEHDDCPDALEMLWSLIEGKYKPSAAAAEAMAGR